MTWLILNPQELQLAIGPGNNVFVRLDYPHDQTGLAPGVELAIEMTPAQAREVGHKLLRKAECPLTIPGVMTLTTLADMLALIEKRLPAECRERSIWRHVADRLADASAGADIADVAAPLLLVLAMERVPCRPR